MTLKSKYTTSVRNTATAIGLATALAISPSSSIKAQNAGEAPVTEQQRITSPFSVLRDGEYLYASAYYAKVSIDPKRIGAEIKQFVHTSCVNEEPAILQITELRRRILVEIKCKELPRA